MLTETPMERRESMGVQDFFQSSAASPCLHEHCGCTRALLIEAGSFLPSDLHTGHITGVLPGVRE